MRFQKLGKIISDAEILNISEFGIWILVKGHEYFMDYKHFPWFERATVRQIYNFNLVRGRHLHWPDLDVDLEVDSLQTPEHYPLVAKSTNRKTKLKLR